MREYLCNTCPRHCNIPRSLSAEPGKGEGVCKMGRLPVVARCAAHLWEEPCISGECGSGAVFFSGCSLKCVFCQNYAISKENLGKEISIERLREIFFELADSGVHNINLVNPTHFAESILLALAGEPLPIPVVYNTGGYDTVETLRKFEGKIQIYLPDFKYADSSISAKYSSAPDYPTVAADAIKEMFRQVGPYKLDDNGIIKSGVIIRHLILPNNLENTYAVIDWVKQTFPKGSVLFSLMSQYVPCGKAMEYEKINRPLTANEYKRAADYLYNSGIEDGFIQERTSASKVFIPSFDFSGI